jgi:hypothetical protein
MPTTEPYDEDEQQPVTDTPLDDVPVSDPAPEPEDDPVPVPAEEDEPAEPEPAPAVPDESAVAEPEAFRDMLSQYGIDTAGYENDQEAIKAFATQVHQAKQTQQFYENQIYQQSAPAAQQARQPEQQEKTFWNPPEYDASWSNLVKINEVTGEITPDFQAGGTPEIARKVNDYLGYVRSEQSKMQRDPYSYFQEFIDDRIEKRASDLVERRLQETQQQHGVEQFINDNENWLYDHNDRGEVIVQDGNPRLSADGHQFMKHFRDLESMGVPVDSRRDLAVKMLNAARYEAGLQQRTPAQVNESKKQQFINDAAGYSPSSAATMNQSPDATGEVPEQNPHLSLADQIRANLESEGITEKDFLNV